MMTSNDQFDDQPECPLCLEPFGIDDITFFPCACRYQICRFCWHRIRTDENGRCPHCRELYSENPAEYTPPTQEQVIKLKERKKQKQEKKQKLLESRKNLADVRVVQKNLVFVIGLSPRLGDPEVLKKPEYFGKYGKIFKVVINQNTVYSGSQGPSVNAYVTYHRIEDASKAIQAVNNAFIDGRYLKASFGTTKYCSHFLRGTQCPKVDCMYLHELGEEEASFTKEDMHQGKHQEYEVAILTAAGYPPIPHREPPPSNHVPRSQPPRMQRLQQQQQQQQQQNEQHFPQHQPQVKPPEQNFYSLGAESALPTSANWASSKPEKEPPQAHPSYKRAHSGMHPPEPVQHGSRAAFGSIGGHRGNRGSADSIPASGGSKYSSPASRSSSAESVKNIVSCGDGGTAGERKAFPGHRRSSPSHGSPGQRGSRRSSRRGGSNKTTVSSPQPPTGPARVVTESAADSGSGVVVNDNVRRRGSHDDEAESVIKEERKLNSVAGERGHKSEAVPVMRDEEDELDAEVLRVLSREDEEEKGVAHDSPSILSALDSGLHSGSFGSLGVSWQGHLPRHNSPVAAEGPSLWGDRQGSPTSSVEEGESDSVFDPWSMRGLSNLLSETGSGDLKSVDERERLASASYVNYGPTTTNGLDELQARQVTEKPLAATGPGEGGSGAGEMLRSSLEDGFKAMFPGMQAAPAATVPPNQAAGVAKVGRAHHAPYVYGIYPAGFTPYSMNQFLHHQRQLQLQQRQQQQQQAQLCQQQQLPAAAAAAAGKEGDWPGLNPSPAPQSGVIGGGAAKRTGDVAAPTKKSAGNSVLAPPPGFTATNQNRDVPAVNSPATSSSTGPPASSVGVVSGYSLWGSSPGVQGLFQQAQAQPTSSKQPQGAIPHSVLEASLFANPSWSACHPYAAYINQYYQQQQQRQLQQRPAAAGVPGKVVPPAVATGNGRSPEQPTQDADAPVTSSAAQPPQRQQPTLPPTAAFVPAGYIPWQSMYTWRMGPSPMAAAALMHTPVGTVVATPHLPTATAATQPMSSPAALQQHQQQRTDVASSSVLSVSRYYQQLRQQASLTVQNAQLK